jgi:methylenetetrahydrofolate dehydrogenase (NADP+)/methenyltetrahydrofolate cyclohydrolase
MTARILDGKALSNELLQQVAARVSACRGRGVEPCLAVVLVGEDPASQVYVRSKEKRAAEAGILARDHRLPVTTTTDQLLGLVRDLNGDPAVHGILVQLPLPDGIDSDAVLLAIDPSKDVDGFHPDNLGRLLIGKPRFVACTPSGCMHLLRSSGVELRGARAIVLGRSTIVGKPVAQLLLQADATVMVAHSRSREMERLVAESDVVVAAVGRPRLVKGDWIKPGAVVVDVGINRLPSGELCGDVDYGPAAERASAITPVPGGVGPMTIACLLENVVQAAEARLPR